MRDLSQVTYDELLLALKADEEGAETEYSRRLQLKRLAEIEQERKLKKATKSTGGEQRTLI